MGVSQHSIFDPKKAISDQRSALFLANADQTRRAASSMPVLQRDADSRVQKLHADALLAIAEIGRQLNILGVFHRSSARRTPAKPTLPADVNSSAKQVLQSVAQCPSALLNTSARSQVTEAAVSLQAAAAA